MPRTWAPWAEPDSFYYDAALRLIAAERGERPAVLLRLHDGQSFSLGLPLPPGPAANWRDPGNSAQVDEYLRRQAMSAEDYAQFRARLAREFPGERFLIVRFGDHQPQFAKHLIDPTLEPAELGRRIAAFDPGYFTTYYAIDAVNFRPAELTLAIDKLDAPYLPLVILEAAGLPLDASFAEQKKILERCQGLFYRCAGGAEARRFNRLLIDAGLIKGCRTDWHSSSRPRPWLAVAARGEDAGAAHAATMTHARSTAPAVALGDVTIAFRLADGTSYTAVERASLDVADGEFVSIVGPTGCGKTTLLNVAAGLIGPSAGSVAIFASPLKGLNRSAGYLFQAEALFPWKTALENVAIGLEIGRPRARTTRGRAPRPGSPGSALRASPTAIRTCCRAASASAWGLPRC